MRKGDVIELKIENLAFGGAGIGRVDKEGGKIVVFVENALPGDVVMVEIDELKRNYAAGFVKEFVSKSAERVEARCPHFGAAVATEIRERTAGALASAGGAKHVFDRKKNCGGCRWQDLAYDRQLFYKTEQVREILVRLGGFSPEVVRPILGLKDPWFYRNKMEFSFAYTPWNGLELGLHMKGRRHDLTLIDECFLMQPFVGSFVARSREFFRGVFEDHELKTHNYAPKRGGVYKGLQSLTVRRGFRTGEIMVILNVENIEVDFEEDFVKMVREFFAENSKQGDALVSIILTQFFNVKGTPKKKVEKVLWGKEFYEEILHLPEGGELKFEVAAQAFFQPNSQQAEALYAIALEAAGLTGAEVAYDLCCGTGTIGMFAAKWAARVFGVEMEASAVRNAKQNAALNHIKNIEFFEGDVKKILPTLPEKADVILVDPPRAGLHEDVVATIGRSGAERVVYISCNPTTLARDLKILVELGYELEFVQPVDQFCHTYHIECVAKLVRAK